MLDEENRAVDERKVERARERPSALRALVSALLVLGFIVAIVVTAVILFWPRHDDEIVEVVPSLIRPEVAAVIDETSASVERPEVAAAIDEISVSVERPEVAAAIDEASMSVNSPEIVTFVVDTSLSMAGGNLQQAKEGLRRALEAMLTSNQVGLLSFGDTVRPGVSVGTLTVENQHAIGAEIDNLEAKGETALYDAIRAGIEMTDSLAGQPTSIRAVMVLSDGQANKGETRLDDIIHMSSRLGRPIPSYSGFENVVLARDETGRRVEKKDIVGSSLAMDTNHPVQIFFIGIGEVADIEVGRMLAEATGAKFQGTTKEDLANLLEKFFKDS